VIEDYNKGITNPNGVFSGVARHNMKEILQVYQEATHRLSVQQV
jgi:proline dehydrogenase